MTSGTNIAFNQNAITGMVIWRLIVYGGLQKAGKYLSSTEVTTQETRQKLKHQRFHVSALK
jgi:hypothetical protein